MNTTKITTVLMGIVATGTLLISALPADAQTVSTYATTSVSTANSAARLSTIITKGNADIAARIASLNVLNTRVQAMKNESASEKANISTQVQTNITGLTALQAKLDADTDVTTARADASSIFTTYRIYALVIPQGYLLASSDRITTITSLMTQLGAHIQTRITADEAAGKNVSALTAALADMNTQITNASSQSQAAQNGVINLVPDQGNTTVAASNKAALLAARANIKTAASDLTAARADITTMLQGLKALES